MFLAYGSTGIYTIDFFTNVADSVEVGSRLTLNLVYWVADPLASIAYYREALRGRSGEFLVTEVMLTLTDCTALGFSVDPDVPSRLRMLVSNSGVL